MQQTLWAPLQAWCMSEDAAQGLSVALWTAAPGSPEDGVVETFSRHLDGSHQLLAAGGALAGLLLRLRVKVFDVMPWRRREASDPWDCGYVLNEPSARTALARFAPRRATLVVAVDWPEDALVDAITGMARSSTRFAHPVRWLVVRPASRGITGQLLAAGVPVQRLQPRAAEA